MEISKVADSSSLQSMRYSENIGSASKKTEAPSTAKPEESAIVHLSDASKAIKAGSETSKEGAAGVEKPLTYGEQILKLIESTKLPHPRGDV